METEARSAPDRRTNLADQDRAHPAGVQARNFGYWQADGATRAAAKRSKRP
ncbi:MAG TPA: hypothetical protein VFD88_02180 [Clostridia bacterium]|nr:hypothetical protein [Clostridia bacterium]